MGWRKARWRSPPPWLNLRNGDGHRGGGGCVCVETRVRGMLMDRMLHATCYMYYSDYVEYVITDVYVTG